MSGRVARFLGVCRVQPIAVEQAEAFDGLILFAWLLFGEQRGHVLVCYHLWRRGRIQVLHRVVLLARQASLESLTMKKNPYTLKMLDTSSRMLSAAQKEQIREVVTSNAAGCRIVLWN